MNLNGIINQITRIFVNRAVNWGIRKGTDTLAKRSGGTTTGGKMTPQARKQAQTSREAIKRARQAARITRRMGH